MNEFREIICDEKLQYHEKRQQLAYAAECALPYPEISPAAQEMLASGVLCDIFEGHAPYRPRYALPNYARFLAQGSEYLDLKPPVNLYDAINALLIIYRYVPSITGYPVYLGQIDDLLEPFATTVSASERDNLLRLYLMQIDRTLPDAFVHMNIGPHDSLIGRTLLRLEKELCQAVPNISFKYGKQTPDDFALLALDTALTVGKPYFANHDALTADLTTPYGVASCYNTLPLGGGSHTLVRLNLKKLALASNDANDFFTRRLPEAVEALAEVINAKSEFLVTQSGFFTTSFLVREGLLQLDRFTSMAGIFGLYECVLQLSGGLRLGKDDAALDLAKKIIAAARDLVKAQPASHCGGSAGKLAFHAQSGIDSDVNVTAGVRIRIGEAPDLPEQLQVAAALQPYFDAGASEICIFDQTAQANLTNLLPLVKKALQQGIRILALNRQDSELVRITGYLVKRCDIEKYFHGETLREDTVKLGAESIAKNRILEREVRQLS